LYLVTQITTSCHSSTPHQIHSPSHEEPDHFLNDPAAAYYGYPQSPMVTHSCLDAPIPPTPQSHTTVLSMSSLISGMGYTNGIKLILPPYSTAPLVGSPYLYPYRHIHCRQTYRGSYNRTLDHSQMDPNVIHEQLALQMQIYALNNGMVSDSMLSSLSMPFLLSIIPGHSYRQTICLVEDMVLWTHLQACV
jgi:hypothetical protein